MIEGTLRSYYFQLRLSVEGYEVPDFKHRPRQQRAGLPGCDRGHRERGLLPPPRPNPPQHRAAELHRIAAALQREGSGQAVLGDPDTESGDEFGLSISLSNNAGTLQGFVANRAAARLGFGPIEIDRTFLTDALVLFDEIVETFPVRGDTADQNSSRTTNRANTRPAAFGGSPATYAAERST